MGLLNLKKNVMTNSSNKNYFLKYYFLNVYKVWKKLLENTKTIFSVICVNKYKKLKITMNLNFHSKLLI